MYSHIIGVDDNLWDITRDGFSLPLDHEGMVVDRKSQSQDRRKIYRNHHRVRGILVKARSHSEYTKIVDKSTAKVIFDKNN